MTEYFTAQLIDILSEFQIDNKISAAMMAGILMSLYMTYMEQARAEL
ncbi:hypothetical protein J6TS2_51080 [Heyndrickxia sporothermodurans]|nr:hypothetical protein J6TS2_51080 [Heyndrickxia sporothermodurans]